MKWSKLKQNVEGNLADSVKGKVEFFTTAYKKPDSLKGRGWITIEKEEVVNFSTYDSSNRYVFLYNETTPDNKKRYTTHEKIKEEERQKDNLVEMGEFSRFDLHICMFESLNMSIEEILNHESPIMKVLGILDKRTGKRKLKRIKNIILEPLPKFFLEYRLKQEKMTENPIETM